MDKTKPIELDWIAKKLGVEKGTLGFQWLTEFRVEARKEGYIEGQAAQVEQNVIVEMDKQIEKAISKERKRIIEWAEKYQCDYCGPECNCHALEKSLINFLKS